MTIKVRIEYTDVNEYGGFSRYALTVRGTSIGSVEREFINRISGWDAVFTEVIS